MRNSFTRFSIICREYSRHKVTPPGRSLFHIIPKAEIPPPNAISPHHSDKSRVIARAHFTEDEHQKLMIILLTRLHTVRGTVPISHLPFVRVLSQLCEAKLCRKHCKTIIVWVINGDYDVHHILTVVPFPTSSRWPACDDSHKPCEGISPLRRRGTSPGKSPIQ